MKNWKNILIGVLIVIIAILIGVLFMTLNKEKIQDEEPIIKEEEKNDDNSNEENYNYQNITGLYTYEGEYNGEFTPIINLYLDENGLFYYKASTMASYGKIGNYTIVEDEIHLNYLFDTNSGAGLEVTQGNKNIKINKDNTLTDDKTLITDLNNIDLIKKTSKDEEDWLEENDITNILNNYEITNQDY